MGKTDDEVADINLEINAELAKAKLAEDALDHTFTCLKDPGMRSSPTWEVATISYLTYEEIHKVFKEPWVWGATVLGTAFKGKIVTEWGFKEGDGGREWAIRATWPAKGTFDKAKKADWTLGGTGTDYDSFMTWFAGRINRQLPVVPTEDDTQLPKMRGAVNVFGLPPAPVKSASLVAAEDNMASEGGIVNILGVNVKTP